MQQFVVALGMPRGWGLVVTLLLVLLLFAPRIPKIARGIGEIFGGFKKGLDE